MSALALRIARIAATHRSAGGGDPHWSKVSSLLHFGGADGSTSFTDQKGTTWTRQGNAVISTAAGDAFGAGSAGAFDGNGDYLQAATAPAFDFGSGDFTIEGFVRVSGSLGSFAGIVGKHVTNASASGHVAWLVGAMASKLTVSAYAGGTTYTATDTVTLAAGSFVHFAAARSGPTLRLFKGGALVASVAIGTATLNTGIDIPVTIGSVVTLTGPETNLGWKGQIDELRITKGVARYVAAFTPPDAPFPDL